MTLDESALAIGDKRIVIPLSKVPDLLSGYVLPGESGPHNHSLRVEINREDPSIQSDSDSFPETGSLPWNRLMWTGLPSKSAAVNLPTLIVPLIIKLPFVLRIEPPGGEK